MAIKRYVCTKWRSLTLAHPEPGTNVKFEDGIFNAETPEQVEHIEKSGYIERGHIVEVDPTEIPSEEELVAVGDSAMGDDGGEGDDEVVVRGGVTQGARGTGRVRKKK